jgi:dTDP-4-dehydrorhamnose reductase
MDGSVLVLGANGQVGMALRRRVESLDREVVFADRSIVDITDPDEISAAIVQFSPSLVVNLAAYTNVDGAESEVALARAVNRDGAAHVATASAAAGAVLIHLSTDFVFDGHLGRPYREDDPISPAGVYGATKAEGEEMVRRALDRHLIIRTAWVFGPDHPNFVSAILRRAIKEPSLKVVSDQQGGPTSTADIADTVVHIIEKLDPRLGPWGTYHYAGAPAVSRFVFAQAIVDAVATRMRHHVEFIPILSDEIAAPAARPVDGRLNCQKLSDAFGIEPPAWQAGFSELAASLLQNITNE